MSGVILLSRDAGPGENLTTLTSAKGITESIFKPATGDYAGLQAEAALIRVEVASIRFWLDGTDPTTSTGLLMDEGDSYLIGGARNVRRFKCINAVGGNGAAVSVIPFF